MRRAAARYRQNGRRWLVFVLATAAVFALVPMAGELQARLAAALGKGAPRWLAAAALATALVAAAAWLFARRDRREAWRGLAWLLFLAALVGLWVGRFEVAAEPVHVVSFLTLGALAYRALRGHLNDHGVYLAAAALVAVVGTLDEALQWLTPGRYWDLADVGLNATSGALAQVAIWKGFRPPGVAPGVSARSVQVVARLLLLEAALLLACLVNTPARIEAYAARLPGLGYLGQGRDTRMIEYGHLYADPEIGRFRSRLAPEELARVDRESAAAAARVLDRYRRPARYGRFLERHPPSRHPFLYEARVHLFHRDRYWTRARRATDPAERRRLATLAWRENRILERYFPETWNRTRAAWDDGRRRRVARLVRSEQGFDSEVSNWLVTSFSETQAVAGLLAALVALALVERGCARRLRA